MREWITEQHETPYSWVEVRDWERIILEIVVVEKPAPDARLCVEYIGRLCYSLNAQDSYDRYLRFLRADPIRTLGREPLHPDGLKSVQELVDAWVVSQQTLILPEPIYARENLEGTITSDNYGLHGQITFQIAYVRQTARQSISMYLRQSGGDDGQKTET